MTVHSWAAMISIFTVWPIVVWQFAGMALNAGWVKRGVIRDLFHEIRPFYLTLVAAHYCAEVVAGGHVVNVWAGVGLGFQILNWFLFRNSGGWPRRSPSSYGGWPVSADRWRVRHPGIGVLDYGSEAEARVAAGTAGEVLPPDAVPARDVDAGPVVDGWREACDEAVAESGRMEAERDRLREKYVAEHEAHTSTMFERDQLREAVARVRALHSPKPGWEREWTDPAEALRKGWVLCGGCGTGSCARGLKNCPTLAALDGADGRNDRD